MAKRKKEEIIENFLNETLDDIMSDRFGSYSKYIIQERALPDARDGLKPVQRRILYSMYIDGNTFDKPHRKSAKTVGSVMGTFHPHGDSSIYEAMVRMSQDWKINVPLIDMHGNNGSIDDDPPAAMRYTEARLAKNAELLLDDIDYDSVAMTNNYDDTHLEPTVLPARYPVLLVNGSTGIASGYATNIAPHNLHEIVEATIYRLQNPECSLEELMEFVKGPDFPTGAIVQGKEQIKEVFATGKGKVVVRSKCEILEGKTGSSIIVTEIPYEVIKSSLVKKISDIYLSRQIEGIVDVRDESGRDGLRIVIECKKDANCQQILNYLYKNTDLQINYSYNNVAIVNHKPVLMSLAAALDAFIEHRREVVLNRSRYLRDKKMARLHIIEGLIKAISILDDVIALIRKSKDKKDAKERLKSAFLFTEEQAEAIVSLRLYRLSSTDIMVLKEENATLVKEIAELNAILSSKQVLDQLLVKELKEVNEMESRPRRTIIEDEVSEVIVDKMAMIPNEPCYISVSRDGYLKRFSERAFNANQGSIPSVKEGDALLGIKGCDTLDTLLLFSNKGNYAYVPIYKIDECKFKDIGKHVSHYVRMEGMEKFVGAIIVKNFDTFAFVVTATKNGMIKKSSLPRMNVERSSKALTCMKLKPSDELVSVCVCYDDDDLILLSKDGYCNRYSSKIISDLAAKAQGVMGMNVKADELSCVVADHHDGKELLIATDKGGFKRIHLENLDLTSRNTKGYRVFRQIKSRPHGITNAMMVSSYNAFYIYNEGQLDEMAVSEVPFMDLEQSFSNPRDLKENYFILRKDMSDIDDVQIVDIPEGYYSSQASEETQTSLFD
ncbi:MAG: DNA topoisomerase IV subunit A [Erysipelotrichaceae bacterium]|nr:DNA topoisomerase IV subunit A [Erysipelotrichaceae bacterium]